MPVDLRIKDLLVASLMIGALTLSAGYAARAQSADSLLARGRALEKSMQEGAALTIYRQLLAGDSDNLGALTRASVLLIREGKRQKTPRDGKSYYLQARTLSARALGLRADDKEANLSMAMALAQLSLSAGAKEKAGYIRDVKTYADKALLIDSTYAEAWRVLGNWNLQVSNLGFAEKAATKLLFGSLPAATTARAVADLEKSHRLAPASVGVLYDLANASHAAGQDLAAIDALKQALRLRPILQDDRAVQQQCREMLERLQ